MDFYKENLEKISINDNKYNDIKRIDNTMTSYININPISETGIIDINVLDDLKIKNKKVENNTIRIVDITRS
jgi:hypothetical protein